MGILISPSSAWKRPQGHVERELDLVVYDTSEELGQQMEVEELDFGCYGEEPEPLTASHQAEASWGPCPARIQAELWKTAIGVAASLGRGAR